MKRLLVCILLAPLVALAQAPAAPPCFPLVNGYPVGAPAVINGDHGTHIYWACTDIKGETAKLYGWSCLRDQCSRTALAAALYQITRASARVGTAKALWAEHVQTNCQTERTADTQMGVMCRERFALEDEAFKEILE